MRFPKWATPERRAHLVRLFDRSRGFCVWEEFPCLVLSHQYEVFSEDLIHYWVEDDREERQALRRAEEARMHQDRRRIWRGQFDTTAREVYAAKHPLFYVEGIGMSALTRKPVAKVRIACSTVRLWVELPSKNQRRKARRYGKGSPQDAIAQAVKDYLSRH